MTQTDGNWWPTEISLSPDLAERLPPWTQFEFVTLMKPFLEARRAVVAAKVNQSAAAELSDHSMLDECTAFANSRYCVLLREAPPRKRQPKRWHMLIQRRDGERPGTERYTDFMRIRDELIGPEHEAIEVYPARSRETDVANVYHLWVARNPADEFPVGLS